MQALLWVLLSIFMPSAKVSPLHTVTSITSPDHSGKLLMEQSFAVSHASTGSWRKPGPFCHLLSCPRSTWSLLHVIQSGILFLVFFQSHWSDLVDSWISLILIGTNVLKHVGLLLYHTFVNFWINDVILFLEVVSCLLLYKFC